MAWDYTLTTYIVHLIITCAVSGGPAGWVWWVTIIICALVVLVASELSCYFFRDLKTIKLEN